MGSRPRSTGHPRSERSAADASGLRCGVPGDRTRSLSTVDDERPADGDRGRAGHHRPGRPARGSAAVAERRARPEQRRPGLIRPRRRARAEGAAAGNRQHRLLHHRGRRSSRRVRDADPLRAVQRLAVRMDELLDSLLSYSRIGRADLDRTDVDLRELVDRALEVAGPRLAEADVAVRLPEPGAYLVDGDPVLLAECWSNLLTNAAKYAREEDRRWVEIGVAAVTPPAAATGNRPSSSRTMASASRPSIGERCSASSNDCIRAAPMTASAPAWPLCAASWSGTAARSGSSPPWIPLAARPST